MSESDARTPEHIGVVNPFALAELIAGRKVNWKGISDPAKFLEQKLGKPYEELFDPKNNSPLYPGLSYQPETRSVRVASPGEPAMGANLEQAVGAVAWIDPGDFFEESAELTDPIQGAVGDCYFIAALSSVAWARPYVIAQRTHSTGTDQQSFVDMIEFWQNGSSQRVDVSEKLPLQSPGNNFIYARSSESGEIWPAVFEKAFAKWLTKDPGDRPDILKTAYGDPVGALSLLTGLTPYYYFNPDLSADDIAQRIKENCFNRKTFNPMVAWTYGTAPSPDVDYASAQLVANHAYSILGFQPANARRYVVLRNPWGTYEGTLNVAGGTWTAWDAPYNGGPGWWRPIELATDDGIFALRLDTFKKYFAGFGVVKEQAAPSA